MTIKDDFAPYVDGDGLMAPEPVSLGAQRSSDNGLMFLAEYIIILKRNGVLTDSDVQSFKNSVQGCTGVDNQLHRSPGDVSPDEVDDYYATAGASVEVAYKVTYDLPFRLWRQPQLLCATLSAKHQENKLILSLLSPLYWWSALVIATSCVGVEVSDTDSRRLSWHLIQAVSPFSLICRLASKLWYYRLHKAYGPLGMQSVAALYYLPHGLNANPYSKYWKE